jgi:hypothetical protein
VPNEMAMPALKKLAKEFDLVAVTSRRVVLKPETDVWMGHHFPHLFKELHYAGIWDEITPDSIGHALKRTKAELCREIAADYLIDDQIKHCIGAAEAGVAALLFGAAPGLKAPVGVTPVQHWKDVESYFHV